MRRNLIEELTTRFAMDGNGKLEKEVKLSDFIVWSGIDWIDYENKGKFNFSDKSQDFAISLIDEKDEDFELTIEVKDEFITHCYY